MMLFIDYFVYIYVFNFEKPEHTTKFCKNMIIVLKMVVFENDLTFNPSFNIRWKKAKTVC